MVEFLGDPDFPQKVIHANRAAEITSFQSLFRQYSRLELTRDNDRPTAIAGLEKRLHGALKARGGFGDRDDGGLFHRSLLRRKGTELARDHFLTRISFNANLRIPSWSWMAYKGGIDYTDPPFQSADWETKEIIPPWTGGGLRHTDTGLHHGDVTLSAVVRSFAVHGRGHNEVELTYDTGKTTASDGQAASCVVVAKAKKAHSDAERRFYVLLVTPMQQMTGRGERVYERVGAGYMAGKFIALEKEGVRAKIV